MDIPYLPSISIATSATINRQVLYHLSWETNPQAPSSVLVAVQANVLGTCEGGWNFLQESWIPNQENIDPHLLEASHHMYLVGPIGRPSSKKMIKYAANNPSNLCLNTHGLWQ